MKGNSLTAAERVWNTPTLRQGIFRYLSKTHLIKLLRVNQDLFDQLVRKVWEEFDYTSEVFLEPKKWNKERYKTYMSSIRTITFPPYPTKMVPAITKWPEVFEKYPNATKLIHDDGSTPQILYREILDVEPSNDNDKKTSKTKAKGKDQIKGKGPGKGKGKPQKDYKYTYEYIDIEYLTFEKSEVDYLRRPSQIKKKRGPKGSEVERKVNLYISERGKKANKTIKGAILRKIKELEDDLIIIKTHDFIECQIFYDVFEDLIKKKINQIPNEILLHGNDENLPKLMNLLSDNLIRISALSTRYEESTCTLENILNNLNWDKFRKLEYLRLNCRRDPSSSSSTNIEEVIKLNPDVNINRLPLPRIVSLEIDLIYPDNTNLTDDQIKLEVQWIKNVAKLFKIILDPSRENLPFPKDPSIFFKTKHLVCENPGFDSTSDFKHSREMEKAWKSVLYSPGP
ncbi:uncharacterized protein I206_107027 [Kwoniella pini CBS 10737]|uniref:Uncharacterized protein n=1 Tax=Kwoniella pini CBS 10737 TaxID=1296096 RepID=A0A1B9HZG8_9TREE|nr:uncharacterized protein I206_05430 [Kwoniella pini CBS 10737]OCF48650.1 hypothetical protein I206_05430 [Kwoniella pini CBS 10737]